MQPDDAPDNEAPDTEPGQPDPRGTDQHPAHAAHGGSMAPGLVDDTGHPVGDAVERPPPVATSGPGADD